MILRFAHLSTLAALAVPLALPGLLGGACSSIEGGDRTDSQTSCEALCAAEESGAGCALDGGACGASCTADTSAFSEDCLVKAKAYYDCASQLAYACPVAPTEPETADVTCQSEQAAWLTCRITGE
jgi:hypothetical protein